MPADTPPILYLAYGDDHFALQSFERDMIAQMSKDKDPGMVELNITRLDGRQARFDDVVSAAQSLPFFLPRRMVIVSHAADLARGESAIKRLVALLDELPPSTALVITLPEDPERIDKRKPSLKDSLLKWATAAGAGAFVREYRLPAQNAMPVWIQERTRQMGGQMGRKAAELLADWIGTDTAAAAQEIDKLLTYVDYSRPVEVEDVQALTPAGSQTTVFELVDRMAEGDSRQALRSLRRLLQEQDPFSLFGMITRQFRLLIQARELLDEGGSRQDIINLGIHPVVVKKLLQQAPRFTLDQLLTIYRRLLEIDEQSKTGGMPLDLALETFVAELQ